MEAPLPSRGAFAPLYGLGADFALPGVKKIEKNILPWGWTCAGLKVNAFVLGFCQEAVPKTEVSAFAGRTLQ
jgi:hypothetical protein